MTKFTPEINDVLIMKKPNHPMKLNPGDVYGEIIEITEKDYLIKRIDGKMIRYSKYNEDTVFFTWFDKQNIK